MNNNMLRIITPLAMIVPAQAATVLDSLNGTFKIEESEQYSAVNFDGSPSVQDVGFTPDIGYKVDLTTSTEIFAIAISYGQDASSYAGTNGWDSGAWSGSLYSKTAWDNGASFSIGALSISTTSLGTFETLFGDEDSNVVLYHNASGLNPLTESNDQDEANWSSQSANFIRYQGNFTSEAVIIGATGNIVGGTHIPEPSTSLLGLLGGLALISRRRR